MQGRASTDRLGERWRRQNWIDIRQNKDLFDMLIHYPNIQMDMYKIYWVKDLKSEISSSNSGHGLGWRESNGQCGNTAV